MNAAVSGDASCPEEPQSPGERRLPYAVPALVATVGVMVLGWRLL